MPRRTLCGREMEAVNLDALLTSEIHGSLGILYKVIENDKRHQHIRGHIQKEGGREEHPEDLVLGGSHGQEGCWSFTQSRPASPSYGGGTAPGPMPVHKRGKGCAALKKKLRRRRKRRFSELAKLWLSQGSQGEEGLWSEGRKEG